MNLLESFSPYELLESRQYSLFKQREYFWVLICLLLGTRFCLLLFEKSQMHHCSMLKKREYMLCTAIRMTAHKKCADHM